MYVVEAAPLMLARTAPLKNRAGGRSPAVRTKWEVSVLSTQKSSSGVSAYPDSSESFRCVRAAGAPPDDAAR